MQPHELEPALLTDGRNPLRGSACPYAQAKLGVEHAGLDMHVRVRLDGRCDAQQHFLSYAARARQLTEACDLVEVVDDDPPYTCLQRVLQLLGGLVVPVKKDSFLWELSLLRHV